MIQPKPFLDKFKLRNKSFGVERRRNMSKLILDKAPNFPLTVEYKDIDEAFKNWVENDLDISFDGKRLPTFRLFSNQRINEYAQNWKHLDETGNLLMNFKTITRENNPKHGENQGSSYNIPGNRKYPMFMVPVLQENGQQAYDMYSMRQPFCVDMVYTVNLITNKYELVNKMNQLVIDRFKSINCYISPNNHYMPMILDNISDESEYNIDDRKYYSQSYTIKIKAYIITEEDFEVTKLPSRVIVRMLGDKNKVKSKVSFEEEYFEDECKKRFVEDPFYNKKLTLIINYDICEKKVKFDADFDMVITSFETTNVYDFIVCVNGEKQNIENDIRIFSGDEVEVVISKDDITKSSEIKMIGNDLETVIDKRFNPESSLDDVITEENIIIE